MDEEIFSEESRRLIVSGVLSRQTEETRRGENSTGRFYPGELEKRHSDPFSAFLDGSIAFSNSPLQGRYAITGFGNPENSKCPPLFSPPKLVKGKPSTANPAAST